MDAEHRRFPGSGLVIAFLVVAVVLVGIGRVLPDRPREERPVSLAEPDAVYDPVKAGEPLPPGFRQVVGRDEILPMYEPIFTEPDQVDWPSDMLVIGVAASEEAKAYPVAQLNRREMVVDSLAGIPILVTW